MEAAPAFLGVTRSATGRRWRARNNDDRLALALSQRLDVPEVVGRVLAGRGVDLDSAESFLNPTLKTFLPDPSTFLDMDAAAERIARAVRDGEAIAVFGDYDLDGATSSALLKRFFRAVGVDLRLYIPDRRSEGYGPNAPALQKLAADGVKLVITVDCGTLAHVPLAAGVAAGLEIIVVDHHQAEPELPRALVINPNRLDQAPAHGQLAAVGVAFLLAVAVNRALRAAGWYATRSEPDLRQWLDLVALGTICDVVPLTGVNRALVAQGLKIMGQRNNVGLAALADVAGLTELPGVYHCGFLMGPRVNAGGRVGKSDLGARLLSTDDPEEATRLAAELGRLNAERQGIEAEVQEAAMRQLGAKQDRPIVIVQGEGWHPGVIGIVAARIKEASGKPSFVIAIENGLGKGSGRSVPGIDLGAAVIAASQAGLLINGGGHAMAAGLTVAEANIPALEAFLCDRLQKAVSGLGDTVGLGFDGAVAVAGANRELLDRLDQAGPYGSGNPEPRFAIPSAHLVQAEPVGEKHVRCIIAGADGGRLKAIAFRSIGNPLGTALMQAKSQGLAVHLAGHLRADNWRGEKRVQLLIEDAALLGV